MTSDQRPLNRISRIADVEQRLLGLQSYTLAAVAGLPGGDTARAFPLGDALKLAVDSFGLLKGRLPTADASSFLRGGLDPLFGGLSGLIFAQFGNLAPLGDRGAASESHVADAALSEEDRAVLDDYFRLVQEMSHWKTSFHARRRMHECLRRLPGPEQTEFCDLCNCLAAMLRQRLDPPLPRGHRRTLAAHLDRVAELQTLAALAHVGDSARGLGVRRRGDISAGVAHVYFIAALPTKSACCGCVGFERDRTHLWCSTEWSARVEPLSRRLSQVHVTLDDLDAEVPAILGRESPSFATILDDRPSPRRRISHIILHDQTTLGLPLPCLFDPECRHSVSGGGSPGEGGTLPPQETRIAFWGDFRCGFGTELRVNDESRTVMQGEVPIMSYPAISEDVFDLPGYPAPLPFASYERWFFEDLSREAGVPVSFHPGGRASRQIFLETAAGEANVLHVSTHGEADAENPELSRLFFAGDGRPTYVLLLDILARDWSRYDLVFLNACLSQAGRKLVGEESLALGWAFLAGGAKAVIACRWPVEDRVAWCFVRSFYRDLLTGRTAEVGVQGSVPARAANASGR